MAMDGYKAGGREGDAIARYQRKAHFTGQTYSRDRIE